MASDRPRGRRPPDRRAGGRRGAKRSRRPPPEPEGGAREELESIFDVEEAPPPAEPRRPPERSRRGAARSGQRRRRPPQEERTRPRSSETVQRVIWAIPWIVFAIFILIRGGLLFTATVAVFAVVGLHELYKMHHRYRPLAGAGFLGAAALVLAAHFGDQYQMVLVLAGAVGLTFLFALPRQDRAGVTVSMGITLFGVTWVGLSLAHAVLLRDLPHGDGLVVDVLVAVFVGDTAAYTAGRMFGQRKLAPSISPNKTWEGLVAGLVIATVAFWCAGLYQDWLKGWEALAIGAAVAVTAPLADLFESMVKRDAGVKDTGRFFGPHGGVLDRLDAVMVSAVTAYYVSRAILGI